MDICLLNHQDRFAAWLYNDHLVTCDLNTRHIGLHNPSAAVLWVLLESPTSFDRLAKDFAETFSLSIGQACQDVQISLADWQKNGWAYQNPVGEWQISSVIGSDVKVTLGTETNQATVGSDAVAKRVTAPVTLSEAGIHHVHRQTYCFGDKPFELYIFATAPIPSGSFAFLFCERLIAIFKGFNKKNFSGSSIQDLSHADDIAWVALTLDNEEIKLQDSCRTETRLLSPELVVGHIYESCLSVSYPDRNVVFTLHAAGVSQVDGCIALAGVSGVGKSTLAAYLARSGWNLLGDDIVAIEMVEESEPKLGLLPFPTAISLKPGSWPILKSLFPELNSLEGMPYGEKFAKYVALEQQDALARWAADKQPTESEPHDLCSSYAWKAIVLPQFKRDPDQENSSSVIPLTPAEGLRGLLTAGMSLFGDPSITTVDKTLKALIRLPCFSVKYGDFHEAQACLKKITKT